MARHRFGIVLGSNRPGIKAGGAFTLIELLVVVAIIVVLIAMLVPALEKAMAAAQTAKCMSQVKALAMAWRTYAVDNKQMIVHPSPGALYSWVWYDHGNTAETYRSPWVGGAVYDPNTGLYVGGGASVGTADSKYDPEYQKLAITDTEFYKYHLGLEGYKCPTDPRNTYVRTYSMPYFVGDGIRTMGGFSRSSSVMVFLEEFDLGPANARGFDYHYNLGDWRMGADDWNAGNWVDPLANFHPRQHVLSFVDGHGEARQIVDDRVWREVCRNNFYATTPRSEDFDYYRRAYYADR